MSVLAARNDRRAVRHAATLRCIVTREADHCRIATRSRDVSPDGMRATLDECSEICVGDTLLVALEVGPFDTWVDTRATVTRVVHGRRPGDEGPEIGMRFDELGSVARLILRGAMRKVAPPLPKRPARPDFAASVRSIARDGRHARRIDWAAAVREIASRQN